MIANASDPETGLQNLADRLVEMIDQASDSRQAAERLDEIAQLLWLASSLDPEAEAMLGRSRYLSRPTPDDEM